MKKKKEGLEKESYTLTNLPEYDYAFQDFLVNTSRSLMSACDPILSQVRRGETERTGPTRVPIEAKTLDFKPIEVKQHFTLPFLVILSTDIDSFNLAVYEATQSGLESLMPQFFKFISDVCDATGQVVDARGQTLSYDLINDLIERTELTFDEKGNPNQEIVMHPDTLNLLSKTPPTEEQRKRTEEILERKKAEYLAKKRSRKLS